MGKSLHPIRNWSEYNRSLVERGNLTVWMDASAIASWHNVEHHGGRGRGYQYSDTAIETVLMLKAVFKLPLRALEGFVNSLFRLLKVDLVSPDYSSISKRAKTVIVNYRPPSRGPVAHVVIDSTGLKVYGDGEWKVRKHGAERRREWRKMHLAVDAATHDVVAAEVSLVSVGDNEVLPTLLNPLRRKVAHVSADGAYDTRECHRVLLRKGCKATIPPREGAALWPGDHPRNEAVNALKAGELKAWKKSSGYHRRSLAETAMYRYKQLISPKLSLRHYNAQVAEALIGVKVINKMNRLGLPVRQPLA